MNARDESEKVECPNTLLVSSSNVPDDDFSSLASTSSLALGYCQVAEWIAFVQVWVDKGNSIT